MKKVFIILAVFFVVSNSHAQGVKVGFIHTDTVLISMPEYPEASSQIETYSNQLAAQLESKQTEFQEKYNDFTQNSSSWIDAVLADKQEELQRLDQNIREFQQQAQVNLRSKEDEHLGPLYKKIETALTELAKSEGYDYVSPGQVYLYANPAHNLTDKLIAKLGGTKPSN